MSGRILTTMLSLLLLQTTTNVVMAADSNSGTTLDQQATELFISAAEQGIDYDNAQNCAIFGDFLAENAESLSDHNFNRITFRLNRSQCDNQMEPIAFTYLKAIPESDETRHKTITRVIQAQDITPTTVSMNSPMSDTQALENNPMPRIIKLKVLQENDNPIQKSSEKQLILEATTAPEKPVTQKAHPAKTTTLLRVVNLEKYGALALRKSPQFGSKIKEVPYGSEHLALSSCRLLKPDSPMPWCKITYDGVTGWAYSNFLEIQTTGQHPEVGDYAEVQTETKKPIETPLPVLKTLNILNRPIHGSVVAAIDQQNPSINVIECVTPEEKQEVWCYLRQQSNVGWISASELQKHLPSTNLQSVQQTAAPSIINANTTNTFKISGASQLNIRSAPHRGRIKAKLAIGTDGIDVVSCNPKGKRKHAWCLISKDEIKGWAYARYLVNENSGMPPS